MSPVVPTAIRTLAPDCWEAPHKNEAAIHAAALKLANKGGGRVILPVGRSGSSWAEISKSAPLPMYNGVFYQGVAPAVIEGDGVTYTRGTVLKGDGSFRGAEYGVTDTVTPDVSGLQGAGLSGIGFDGFTEAVRFGAQNRAGMQNGVLDQLYAKNCSGWAFNLINMFAMQRVGYLRAVVTDASYGGIRYAQEMPQATFLFGNHAFEHLFVLASNTRKARGIVFEARGSLDGATVGGLNELTIHHVQCNRAMSNPAALSVAATTTNGSTAIVVPDGTQFRAHMLVIPTTTALGFTAGRAYYVQNVNGNTLTLGNSSVSAPIAATGAGTLTLETKGQPNISIVTKAGQDHLYNSVFHKIDSEGAPSAGLYVEGSSNVRFALGDIPGAAQTTVVLRTAEASRIESQVGASVDADAASVTTTFDGSLVTGGFVQRELPGRTRQDGVGRFRVTSAAPALESRKNGFVIPGVGLGDRMNTVTGSMSLDTQTAGDVVYAGTGGATLTLPTIAHDPAQLFESRLGLSFDIINTGTGACTVAASGGQLINQVTGRTSMAVPAQSSMRVVASIDASGNLFWAARPQAHMPSLNIAQNITTDADVTITPTTINEVVRHSGTLTADRTVTLAASIVPRGGRLRLVREGSGAFNLNVVVPSLTTKALATGTWAEFVYDGGTTWRCIGSGTV